MWRGPNVLPGAANIMIVNSNHGGTSSSSPAGNNTDNSSTVGQDGNNNEGTPLGGGPMLVPRAPVSLSDLFLDIVSKYRLCVKTDMVMRLYICTSYLMFIFLFPII